MKIGEVIERLLAIIKREYKPMLDAYFALRTEIWILSIVLPMIALLMSIKIFINYKRVTGMLHSVIDIVIIERRKEKYSIRLDEQISELYNLQIKLKNVSDGKHKERQAIHTKITKTKSSITTLRKNIEEYDSLLKKETQMYLSSSA